LKDGRVLKPIKTGNGLERKRLACSERDSAKKAFVKRALKHNAHFRAETTLIASEPLALQSFKNFSLKFNIIRQRKTYEI